MIERDERDPNVYDYNDYQPFLKLTHPDPVNGRPIATSVADLDVWLAATADGGPIHASLKVRAVEMTEAPGHYAPIFNGGDIHTHMFVAPAAYDKKDVFVVAMNVAQNVFTVERVKAFKVRRVS